MSDEAAFLAGIRAEPKDDLRRLVYADWLDERSDDESRRKAEYLRLEVHISGLADDHPERDGLILQLRDLALPLPVDWKTEVAKVPIENCGGRWRFQCPKRWDQLEETSSPEVRYCTACRESVYYCDSVDQAWRNAEELGRCVVIDLGVRRTPGDMDLLRGPAGSEPTMMGYFVPPYPPLDFNPGGRIAPPPPPADRPGFLRRVWRKLTGM